MNIVLVEDNVDLAESMQTLLVLQGHDATVFTSSRQLLDAPECVDQADLVITDYYLPDLNGVELIRKLRARRPGVRVMLLTGSREETIVRAASQVADCGVLHKPLDCEELDAALRELSGVTTEESS
jgi:two-component system phosphoglycerate transport system response regulator PgtA